MKEAILKEIQVLRKLDHFAVVNILEVYEDE